MANELQASYATGKTGSYFLVRSSTGTIWNGSAFEAYTTANLANYVIPATEQGTASGFYAANMPAVGADIYSVIFKERIGGSAAESDPTGSAGNLPWDGTQVITKASVYGWSGVDVNLDSHSIPVVALSLNGLDAISAADPGVIANMTTFPKKLMAMWQYIFGKSTTTATQLKTYAADNSVNTTATVSNDGATATKNAAT